MALQRLLALLFFLGRQLLGRREEPKDLKGALQEAMDFHSLALVNVMISQESICKPQQFKWHQLIR